jgi:hypothetical protein
MDSTIHRFKNARIAMFMGDHPPVHVHLLAPGMKVSISVETLKTQGRGDAKTIAEALRWIADNHETIIEIWKIRGAKR